MTEFALILPVFLVIVGGLLGFGRVFFYWIDANHLANETARWAVVDRNPFAPKTLQQYARESGGTLEFADAKVCISVPGGGPPTVGGPLEVKVAKGFSFIPLLGIGDITIRGSATLRVERLAGSSGTTPLNYSVGSPYGACT